MQTSCQHSLKTPLLSQNDTYYFSGRWNQKTKSLCLKNNTESVLINLSTNNKNTIISGNLPINTQLTNFVPVKDFFITINKNPKNISANLSLTTKYDIKLAGQAVFNFENNFLENNFRENSKKKNNKNKWSINLYNTTKIQTPKQYAQYAPYKILPKNLNFKIFQNNLNKNSNKLDGTYKIRAQHEQTKEEVNTQGKISFDSPNLTIYGQTPYAKYIIQANTEKPGIPVTNLVVTRKNKEIAKLTQDKKNPDTLSGSIKYSFLQSLLPINIRRILLGNKGNINISLTKKNNKKFYGSIDFLDGKIHIPGNYNIIKNIHTKFNYDHDKTQLTLDNTKIKFHKGSIDSQRINFLFNQDGSIKLFHTDLQANNLLINYKNDFFGFISGNMLVKKRK